MPPGPALHSEAPASARNSVTCLGPGQVVLRDGRLLWLQRWDHKGRGWRRWKGIVLGFVKSLPAVVGGGWKQLQDKQPLCTTRLSLFSCIAVLTLWPPAR